MHATNSGTDAHAAPVRAVFLDVDGVLRVDHLVTPGASATLTALRDAAIPLRLLTNTTTRSRATLGSNLRSLSLQVHDDEIITAGLASADYVRRRHPGARVLPIVTGDVLNDFDGITLTDTADANVVLIGGAEHAFTWPTLNIAFRALRNGASLLAMHRELYWTTSEGPSIDAGAFIIGLERASGTRAKVVGKPSAPFFRTGLRSLTPRVSPAQVLMVGDSVGSDIRPATRMGLQTAFVRTGNYQPSDLDACTPTWVIDSVADVPALLGLAAPA